VTASDRDANGDVAPVEPFIRGRKVWLRAAERSDIPTFVKWINDARTVTYLGARAPISRPVEERWFERMLEAQGTNQWFFTICRLGDSTPIGNVGLFEVDLRHGGAGIGISIGDPADRGQGLGTDAIEALLDFGFGQLRLERLWLDVYTWNRRAIRSYEKAGFVDEGIQRHAFYRDGAYHDAHRMAILRAEWAARRAAEPLRPPLDLV
jgi:RimJ/RimL family protein N-acetyltransferase